MTLSLDMNCSLCESMMDAFTIVDMNGRILQVNELFCMMLGYNREELLSLTYGDLTPEKWHVHKAQIIKDQVIPKGFSVTYEKEYRRKDGTNFPVELKIILHRDADRNPHEMWATVRDITGRRLMENKLLEANKDRERNAAKGTAELAKTVNALKEEITARKLTEAALKSKSKEIEDLYNHAPCGYHSLDADGFFVRINNIELQWLGYSREEVIGKLRYTDVLMPESLNSFEKKFIQLKKKSWIRNLEVKLFRKNGTILDVLISATALRNVEGSFVMCRTTVCDITKLKRSEEALKLETVERLKALEELRVKDRIMMHQSRQAAMGEMVGNIAHQWRQPLNTLGLLIQQLSFYYETGEFNKELLDASTGKSMDLICHMSQTIDDFRNFFKPDKKLVLFRANQMVSQTISLIEDSFRYRQISITTLTEGDPQVKGYPNEFSQVLLIILLNAKDELIGSNIADATIKIRIYTEDHKTIVTITDNAGGIAENIKEKIFDPYFTTKGPSKGTGIGLFMAKVIVEQNMGGRLTAVNTENGAEFRIEV